MECKTATSALCKLFPSAFVCKAVKHGLNKINLSAPTDKEREREREKGKKREKKEEEEKWGGGGGGEGRGGNATASYL